MARILANRNHPFDPVWHVQLAVLGALILQLVLPDKFAVSPKYLVAGFEGALLLLLAVTTPRLPEFSSVTRKANALVLIALVGASNIYSLALVVNQLLGRSSSASGQELIIASINIYVTNIIIFGLLYWELDGGGPGRRRALAHHERDFLYPQATMQPQPAGWHPTFIDYLYVSSTNATAFSPTDTMPLSRRAKMLMLLQSIVSLVTLALVAARAVNILA
jgi:uncharacterized membrane protein